MCSNDDSAEVVSLDQARAERDIRTCELRAQLVIEWRGAGYELAYDDFENDPPNTEWLWSELCYILGRRGYQLVSDGETGDKAADNDK